MVGSGVGSDRSKEAVGMMALHEALRSVCLTTDWTYSVFWTIRPRPYVLSLSLSLYSLDITSINDVSLNGYVCHYCRRLRGGNGCKVGDDNGSL